MSRIDPQVDFSWGSGSPAPSINPDHFSARWTGELEPRYSETYTLFTVSDDGVRLWVDGQLVINNWAEHSWTEDSVSMALQAGRRYAVKLEFFELTGAAAAGFSWSSQSQPKQVVPKSQLYPAPTPPPSAGQHAADGNALEPDRWLEVRCTGNRVARRPPRRIPTEASAASSSSRTAPSSARTRPPRMRSAGRNVPAGNYSLVARAIDDDGAGHELELRSRSR